MANSTLARRYALALINLSQKETRLEQMKKNPYKRVDSENMTEIEKMDKGMLVTEGRIPRSLGWVIPHIE